MFPVLRVGSKEDAVKQWQYFLLGQGYSLIVDGVFGKNTKDITIQFQKYHGLTQDGVVGNSTWGTAMVLGLSGSTDSNSSVDSQDYPLPPSGLHPLNVDEKNHLFGKFSYVSAPVPLNPEAIKLTDNWAANNIKKIIVPQLAGVSGSTRNGSLFFHQLIEKQLLNLFNEWEAAGFLNLILTFDGSYVPRFKRGSRSILSSHAWGTAFDINAAWNQYGAIPASINARGSTRKLVELANQYGFYWGGHFGYKVGQSLNLSYHPMLDGMHFEVCKIL